MAIEKLWGKYADETIHPLLCHMFDVACVAKVMLDTMDGDAKRVLAEGIGFEEYDEEVFSSFCLFLMNYI